MNNIVVQPIKFIAAELRGIDPERNKKSLKRKKPKGIYRQQCVELPDFMGQKSIVESVNSPLKQKQIHSLRAKKVFMKQREFGWQIVWYNLKRDLKNSNFLS